MKNLPKLIIFGDPKKQGVAEAVDTFLQFVSNKAQIISTQNIFHIQNTCPNNSEFNSDSNTNIQNLLKQSDYAVVFGGDGSIISTARIVSKTNVPIIGVNVGKLGFLAEFNVEELKNFFSHIIQGTAKIDNRMMLDCHVSNTDNKDEKFCSSAVNDIYFTAGPPFRMIELKILVDGQPLAGCVSDGLIISTPTGSTAYNLSAGGPIVSPKMDAIVITPICPHSLSFRPIVINADSDIEVLGIHLNEGTTMSIDGQISMKFSIGDKIKIRKKDDNFMLVNNPFRSTWDTLAAKLSWAEKPKYNKT